MCMYKERYLITGGSGFIGTQLIKQLLLEEHEVTVLTRDEVRTANHFAELISAEKEKLSIHSRVKTISSLDELSYDDSYDVIINLAGQAIADKRWSASVKQQLINSRIDTTQDIYEYVKDAVVKPDVFITGSALGYYGLRDDDSEITESGETDDSFSSQLCQQWEQQAHAIENLGIRTCYLRTGIVLGKGGGALAKMLFPFKMGLGGPIGDGKQWMSWIHLDDIVGLIRYAVENETIKGPLNGTAPTPVMNNTFSKTLAKVLKRPAFLPMPAFAVKLLFGQMGEELLLSGQRVVPEKALNSGYEFKYKELESAFKDCIS